MSVDFSQLYALPYDRGLSFSEREFFLEMFDSESRERISRLHNSADQDRSLLGEYLCKTLLSQVLFRNVEDIQFERTDTGKPFLKDYPALHFNISHSRKWIICALSDHPIGVDIEMIRGISDEVIANVLSSAEQDALQGKPYSQREELFFSYWAAKESYLKALGVGLNTPLSAIEFHMEKHIWNRHCDDQLPHTKLIDFDSNYSCAVTSLNTVPPTSIVNVNEMVLV